MAMVSNDHGVPLIEVVIPIQPDISTSPETGIENQPNQPSFQKYSNPKSRTFNFEYQSAKMA